MDLINNMDHMRISSAEPSSVISSQIKKFQKLKSGVPKVPKQAGAKRDGVINPQNYNFNQFYTEYSDALKTLRINQTRLHVPSGTDWSTSSEAHHVVEN